MSIRDAKITILNSPSQASPRGYINIDWEIKNVDELSFLANTLLEIEVYLSTNDSLGIEDILIDSSVTWLDTDLPKNVSIQGQTPIYLNLIDSPLGNYNLIIKSRLTYRENGVDYNDTNSVNDVAVAPIIIQATDLTITAANAPNNVSQGDTIAVDWQVNNQSSLAADVVDEYYPFAYDAIYLSTDSTVDPQLLERYPAVGQSLTIQPVVNLLSGSNRDVLLKDIYVGTNYPLSPTGSYIRNDFVTIPISAMPGQHYLIFQANSYGNNYGIIESNKSNNFYVKPINILASGFDLKLEPITAPTKINLGEKFNVSWQVKNQGTKSIPSTITTPDGYPINYYQYDGVYLSDDLVLDSTDLLLDYQDAGGLAAGDNYTQTANNLNINDPTKVGNKYLLFATDIYRNLGEDDETNNVWAVPIEITAPDLAIVDFSTPTAAPVGGTISVSWTVENRGTSAVNSDWFDSLYLSGDSGLNLGTDLPLLISDKNDRSNVSLAPGDRYTITKNITLPNNFGGTQYLIVGSDSNPTLSRKYYPYYYYYYDFDYYSNNLIKEGNESNNFRSQQIELFNPPDLGVILTNSLPTTVSLGEQFNVSWKVTNSSTINANATWADRVYISSDSVISADDLYFDYPAENISPLAPNGSYQKTAAISINNLNRVGVPQYAIVATDINNTQAESNETNNVAKSVTPITVTAANLVIKNNSIIAPTTANVNETITLAWTVANQGNGKATKNWYDRVYISNDTTYDDNDTLLASVNVSNSTPLAAGAEYTISQTVSIPNTAFGNRYLIFVTDASNQQIETNELNNYSTLPIQITAPNLTLVADRINAPAIASLGDSIAISWEVKNTGNTVANANWRDAFFLSKDRTLGSGDLYLGSRWGNENLPLAANSIYGATQNITIPNTLSGSYYIIVAADPDLPSISAVGQQQETDKTDNFAAVAIQINSADLIIQNINISAKPELGREISINWQVVNQGQGRTNRPIKERVYFSRDPFISSRSELLLNTADLTVNLNPGESYLREATLNLPLTPDLEAGSYYLIVVADVDNRQIENEKTNNTTSYQIDVTLPALPNLTVADVTIPPIALSGEKATVSWTIKNTGTAATSSPWSDALYWSKDSEIGNEDDIYIGSYQYNGSLAPNESITRTQDIPIAPDASGEWRLIVRTDVGQTIYEHIAEADNLAISGSGKVQQTPYPNLKVTNVQAPATVFSGQQTTLTWTVTNTGEGATSTPFWKDRVWLSANETIDDLDISLGEVNNPTFLSAGESYTITLPITIPSAINGNFKFLVQTDSDNRVYELLRDNDNSGVSNVSQITLTPPPDVQPVNIITPSQAFSGQEMALTWTVVNNGPGSIRPGQRWRDAVYMSTDAVLDANDQLLETFQYAPTVDDGWLMGESYQTTKNVKLPVGISGDFYFLVKTDYDRQLQELAFNANNVGTPAAITRVNLTPPPDLEASVTAPATGRSGTNVQVNYRISNNGSTITPNDTWSNAFYLSADRQLDDDDILLGTQRVYGALDAGSNYDRTVVLTLPNGRSGNYYIIGAADSGNEVFELDNANNSGSSQTIAVFSKPADLMASFTSLPSVLTADSGASVSWTVANQGIGDTISSNWTDELWLSGGGNEFYLGSFGRNGILDVGQSYNKTTIINIPLSIAAGNYNLVLKTDPNNRVYEANATGSGESNNEIVAPVTVVRNTADLQIALVNSPTTAISGRPISISWTGKNRGTARTNSSFWYDGVYLSKDRVLDGSDLFIGSTFHSGAIDIGSEYTSTLTANLPIDFTGTYYAIVSSDVGVDNRQPLGLVFEGDLENNNTTIALDPLVISQGNTPNLVVSSVTTPTTAISSQQISLGWTVKNIGTDAAVGAWDDSIYLSRDRVLDKATDIYLGFGGYKGYLGVGDSYNVSKSVTIPQGLSGPFYVFVVGDTTNKVFELNNEGDNLGTSPNLTIVSLPAPADLAVGNVTIPTNSTPGQDLTIAYSVTNNGPNTAKGNWFDNLYLSKDDLWDANDVYLGNTFHSGDVAVGDSYQNTLTTKLPGVTSGDYKVLVRADIRNAIVESNETNNIGASLNRVNIDVPTLTLDGAAVSGILRQGDAIYYKIEVPAGETVQLVLDSTSTSAVNELYVSYGQMPNRSKFDYGFSELTPDQQVVVPLTQAGTYYVMARGQYVANNSPTDNSYQLKAEKLDFSISSIGQKVGDRSGKSTFEIKGAKFSDKLQAFLDDGQGHKIAASNIRFEDSTKVYATFDLQNAPVGQYNLQLAQKDISLADIDLEKLTLEQLTTTSLVVETNRSASLNNAFEVVEAKADDILYSFDTPSNVGVGNSFDVVVSYANRSNHDVAAPMFAVDTEIATNIQISSIDDPTIYNSSVPLLGISNHGDPTILKAGEVGTIRLRMNAGSFGGSTPINFRALSPDTEKSLPIDYTELGKIWGGESIDNDPIWQETVIKIQEKVGLTWKDYHQSLLERIRGSKSLDIPSSSIRLLTNEMIDESYIYAATGDRKNDEYSPRSLGSSALSQSYMIKETDKSIDAGLASKLLNVSIPSSLTTPLPQPPDTDEIILELLADLLKTGFVNVENTIWEKFDEYTLPAKELFFRTGLLAFSALSQTGLATRYLSDFLGEVGQEKTILPYSILDNPKYTLSSQNSSLEKEIREWDSAKSFQSVADDVGRYVNEYIKGQISSNNLKIQPFLFIDEKVELINQEPKTIFLSTLFEEEQLNRFYDPKDPSKTLKTFKISLYPNAEKDESPLTVFIPTKFDLRNGYGGTQSANIFVENIKIKQIDCDTFKYIADVSYFWKDLYEFDADDSSKDYINKWASQLQKAGYAQPFVTGIFLEDIIGGTIDIPTDKPCNPKPPDKPWNLPSFYKPFVNFVFSRDPNDILGPNGFGEQNWIAADNKPLDYTIRFENDPKLATASANIVRITQTLDDDLDVRTFRVGDFGFGDVNIDVPENRAFYQTRLDLRTTKGIYLDVVAGVDIATREAYWELTSIDPNTGVAPLDPTLGFLPPNRENGEGQGFVTYSVKTKADITDGAVIDAEARIIFDNNEPVDTPAIFNTIDLVKPTSSINALPTNTDAPIFNVSWTGSDNANGSALASYTILVSKDGGTATPWLTDTTLTEATFTGETGHIYSFTSIAKDNAGNVQTTAAPVQITVGDAPAGNPGVISFKDGTISVSEANSTALITLVRADGSYGNTVVAVNLIDGTATGGTDYANGQILVGFNAGETTKTFTIPIAQDYLVEGNETVTLNLASPTDGATLGTQNTATLNILNDDTSIGFANSVYHLNEDGTGSNTITLERIGNLDRASSVKFNIAGGNAINGENYNFDANTLVTFAAGEATKTITIPLVNNTRVEGLKTIKFSLSDPTDGATIDSNLQKSVAIITDDETALKFNFNIAPGTDERAIDGFIAAANTWSKIFSNSIVINADLGFSNIGTTTLAENTSERLNVSYESFRNALATHRYSLDDYLATGNLSKNADFNLLTNRTTNNPNGVGSGISYLDNDGDANNRTIWIDRANAKALGLLSATDTGRDTQLIVNNFSVLKWDFNPNDGIASDAYDFVGLAVHELGHALGFDSGIDNLDSNVPQSDEANSFVTPLDLFRFSSQSLAAGKGTIDWSASNIDKYFSIDGGITPIASFSTGVINGDDKEPQHWKDNLGLGMMDPTLVRGEKLEIKPLDLQSFDVIGWNLLGTAPAVSIVEFSANSFQVNEDGTPIVAVTLSRSGRTQGTATVNIDLSAGEATAESDYDSRQFAVTFADGEVTKTVTIPVIDDTLIESAETLSLNLSSVEAITALGAQTSAVITIIDNDTQLAFERSNYTVNEDGTSAIAIKVLRTGKTTGEVGVTIFLTNGTAGNTDYTSTPINVIFADGEVEKTITVPIVNDTLIETDETINISLTSPTNGATLGTRSTAILTVIDDDVQLAFERANYTVNEDGTSAISIKVLRTGKTTGEVGATVTLTNGTASNYDYDNTPINVTFAAGETEKVITVPIVNDTIYELDETVNLSLTNPTNGVTIGSESTAVVTIISDDIQGLNLIGDRQNNTLIGGAGNDFIDGKEGNDTLNGNDGNDTIIGGNGADLVDGGSGADVMTGGIGNDIYYVDNLLDIVTEDANSGTDTVNVSIDYTLIENLENLNLIGTAIAGTGNNLNNTITGNDRDNILDGKAGNDKMLGGAGNDTYYVDSTGDRVTESVDAGTDLVIASIDYSIASNNYVNVENITLVDNALRATGNALDNILTGNAQNNILDGREGADTLTGGLGDDIYYVENLGDIIIETTNTGSGIDTVNASIDYTLTANVENLTLTGTATNGTGNDLNNTITGNGRNNQLSGLAGDDTLIGNGGNDILDGGTGIDTLQGGGGNDTYIVDSIGDTAIELAGQGTDTVESSIDYILTANVENLVLSVTAIEGTGNDLNNIITGNTSNNILTGGLGNDTLFGGAGADTFILNRPNQGIDKIKDFVSGVDKIGISAAEFGGGLTAGNLSSGQIRLGAGVTTANSAAQRFLFNTTNGNFYFDADGIGGAGAVQIGKLEGVTGLSINDFQIGL